MGVGSSIIPLGCEDRDWDAISICCVYRKTLTATKRSSLFYSGQKAAAARSLTQVSCLGSDLQPVSHNND